MKKLITILALTMFVSTNCGMSPPNPFGNLPGSPPFPTTQQPPAQSTQLPQSCQGSATSTVTPELLNDVKKICTHAGYCSTIDEARKRGAAFPESQKASMKQAVKDACDNIENPNCNNPTSGSTACTQEDFNKYRDCVLALPCEDFYKQLWDVCVKKMSDSCREEAEKGRPDGI